MEAARWRLTNGHYLNVPGIDWEHRETSRDSGRQVRKLFPVPLLLDPRDQADHNYPGEIIVAYEGTPFPRDIVFKGPPTPDMEPLNEAAEKVTEAERPNWKHPIESLSGDYSGAILAQLTQQLDAIVGKQGIPQVPNTSVPNDAFSKLQTQVAELMAKNEELEQRLARRV